MFSQKEVGKDTAFPKGSVSPPAAKSIQIQLFHEKFHTCVPTDFFWVFGWMGLPGLGGLLGRQLTLSLPGEWLGLISKLDDTFL